MSSPVRISFQNFVRLDRSSKQAAYLQIADQLTLAMQNGWLALGVQLPGSRVLAAQLAVHRKTILAAYQELEAQGWIVIKPNQGTFVQQALPVQASNKQINHPNHLNFTGYALQAGYLFSENILLDLPDNTPIGMLAVNDGLPDPRLSPLPFLSRAYSAVLQRPYSRQYLGYFTSPSKSPLKAPLAAHLNHSQGLPISPENLLITTGSDMNLYLASRLLLDQGDVVIVSNPGYYAANLIFQQAGARLLTVPVDQQGLDVNALEQLCQQQSIRMLYVNPGNHYPTTVVLSTSRRQVLLDLALRYGFIIVESTDEYDLAFHPNPPLPLGATDPQGMCITLGSFCKSLAPGFRAGYVVAPFPIITELSKLKATLDSGGDLPMEVALAELLAEGTLNRHLQKTRKIYLARRDFLCNQLAENLPEKVSFTKPLGGLALWISCHKELKLLEISKAALAKNLHLPLHLLYKNKEISAIRLGFASLSEAEIVQAVSILNQAIRS